MTSSLIVNEYKKREDTVDAVQWDGSLGTVQDIIAWILEKDVNASVNAKFTSAGIRLEILTQGQIIYASQNDFIVYGETYGLQTYPEAQFNAIYEVV